MVDVMRTPEPEPADRAVTLLQRTRELLLEYRMVAEQLQAAPPEGESSAGTAERIAYGVLVATIEVGLVTTLQQAMDVVKRFSAPAGPLGEQWLAEQGRKLERGEADGSADLPQ